MPRIEIGAEHRILLGRRSGRAHLSYNVGIALGDAAHVAGRLEVGSNDPHGDAGTASLAGRPVGDRLAAPKTAMGQQVVELACTVADQMGEDLALFMSLQIRAWRRRRKAELRCAARTTGQGTGRHRLSQDRSIARQMLSVKAHYPVLTGCMAPRK